MRRLLFRAFGLTFLAERWIRRRFTTAGLLALGATAAAAVVGLDTNRTLAYQAFTFLVALLTVAMAASLSFRGRFSVRRLLPHFATAGELLAYRVVIRNETARVQAGLTLMDETADPRPAFEELLRAREPGEERRNWFDRTVGYPRWMWLIGRNQRAWIPEVPLPALSPRGDGEARVEIVPLRRGPLRLMAVTLARSDPLGLFRARVTVSAPQSVLVLPRRYPVPALALPGPRKYQQGGVALAASVGDSEEFVALRDYRPGDPVRRIHWKSWARSGRPVVKEFQDEFFVRHALVLDTFAAPEEGARFEEAVSVAASFACAAPTQDALLDLMFVGAEAYCFTAGRGLAHTDRMLEILACVEPATGLSFRALRDAVMERHASLSGCICVLLGWDDERRDLVGRLGALGVPALVLVIGDGAGAPEQETDGAAAVHWLQVGRIAEGLQRL
ncbi:MAG: hypothetical protein A2X51_09375 [Candidatus Rokubacteria bacterium GWC2_70_24]|nr:MAG: hypothetical protein A2X51_09375 [Candidatus Rokubacteria bacterium GWC2_70_24]